MIEGLINAVQKTVRKSEKDGHTIIRESVFLKRIKEHLKSDLDLDEIRNEISELRQICVRTRGENVYVSSFKSALLESQVAEQIHRISEAFSNRNDTKAIKKSSIRLKGGIVPSDEQIKAVNSVLKNGVSIITGGPGTGKTTMILALVRGLKEGKNKTTPVSPDQLENLAKKAIKQNSDSN